MKEQRVFVVNLSVHEDAKIPTQEWFFGDEASKEAIEFIMLAESEGRVYSLQGFQDAMNNENIAYDDVILITDKY